MKDVTEYTVYVYHDFAEGEKKYRGSAKVLLFPGMEQKDIFKTLEEAYCAAGHVKNDFYELYAGPQAPFEEVASTLSGRSLTRNAEEMAKALFAADNRKDAFLNSAELFVQRKETKICNSLGTDVSYGQYSVSGEFVAQSKEPQDVEQYFSFRYEGLDTQALTERCAGHWILSGTEPMPEKRPKPVYMMWCFPASMCIRCWICMWQEPMPLSCIPDIPIGRRGCRRRELRLPEKD